MAFDTECLPVFNRSLPAIANRKDVIELKFLSSAALHTMKIVTLENERLFLSAKIHS